MRFVVLAIVLAIPIADLWVTARVARWTGVPLWVFLVASLLAGLLLLHHERIAFRARTVAALHGEEPLMRGLLDSGRKIIAGVLLIVPGLFSDLLALMLLALPLNMGRRMGPQPATAGRWQRHGGKQDAIDGDYHRVD